MKRRMVWMFLLAAACGSPDDASPHDWDFDERIVIWTDDFDREGTESVAEEEQPREDDVDDVDGPREDEDVEPGPMNPGPNVVEPSVLPAACETDANIPPNAPTTISGRLAPGVGELDDYPCVGSAHGNEHIVRFRVPERMGVEIYTTYEETSFPPVLLLQQGCERATEDLFCSSPLQGHPEGWSGHIRTFLDPGDYTLVIDERTNLLSGSGGDFTVHVDRIELADNAECGSQARLYPDNIGSVPEGGRGAAADLRGCFRGAYELHFWAVTVGSNQSVRVRAEYQDAEAQQGPLVEIRQSCFDTCEGSEGWDVTSVANESDEPREYIVAVAAYRDSPYRVFVDRTDSLADNAVCWDADEVLAGETVTVDINAGSAHRPWCGPGGNEARHLYYSVAVPPQHRLMPEANGAVQVLDYCGSEQCLSQPVNESARTRDFIVVAGDPWDGQTSTFQLTPHVVPVAPNSTCLAPATLPIAGSVRGRIASGGAPAGTCSLVHTTGQSLWYRIAVPGNATVELAVETTGPSNGLGLEVMEDQCGGACQEHWDPYFFGPADPTVTVSNDGPARTYLVAITGPDEGYTPLEFELRAALIEGSAP